MIDLTPTHAAAFIGVCWISGVLVGVLFGRDLRRWFCRRSPAATPEKLPVPHGTVVTPHLIKWIESQPISGVRVHQIVADILARDAYGRRKYGQQLMSEDGRDHVNDARQEILDALQYIQAARIQGSDVRELLPLLRLVTRMIEESERTR